MTFSLLKFSKCTKNLANRIKNLKKMILYMTSHIFFYFPKSKSLTPLENLENISGSFSLTRCLIFWPIDCCSSFKFAIPENLSLLLHESDLDKQVSLEYSRIFIDSLRAFLEHSVLCPVYKVPCLEQSKLWLAVIGLFLGDLGLFSHESSKQEHSFDQVLICCTFVQIS